MDDRRKVISFTVQGRGEFPFDMLRYDSCWPATGTDVSAMLREGERRSVRLNSVARDATLDRWKSFNWHVEGSSYAG